MFNNFIEENASVKDMKNPRYYGLLELYNRNMDPSTYTKVVNELINSNQKLRQEIFDGSYAELKDVLLEKFDIHDESKVKEIHKYLLGENFVENGTNAEPDWHKAVEWLSDNITKVVADSSNNDMYMKMYSIRVEDKNVDNQRIR